MKKSIITLFILGSTVIANAQKMPSKFTITLTDKQLFKLDSAFNIAIQGTDSKRLSDFYHAAYLPIIMQAQRQIADSAKMVKPVVKPKK